jgi:hypothetical protein
MGPGPEAGTRGTGSQAIVATRLPLEISPAEVCLSGEGGDRMTLCRVVAQRAHSYREGRCGSTAALDRQQGPALLSAAEQGLKVGGGRYWCRICDRKSFVRSCCGLLKNCSGGPISTRFPKSKNEIRSATSRANPISCVTTTIVMPV